MKPDRPSLLLSSVVVVVLSIAWVYMRVYMVQGASIPLTYVIPLLVCIWTRRHWQVWLMTVFFSGMAAYKIILTPPEAVDQLGMPIYLTSSLLNYVIGAVVVDVVINLRDKLDRRTELVSAQNVELESLAKELAHQNQSIRAQAEELAHQNEEIESQAEEAASQNEELLEANQRLANREEILQGFLQSSSNRSPVPEMLRDLCRRTVSILGEPAAAVAILELDQGWLIPRAVEGEAVLDLPALFTPAGTLAGLVLEENRTAYVSDLTQRTDLAAPFGPESRVRSILATPFHLEGGSAGVLMAYGTASAHWTEEQFRVIEWVAAQCSLMVDVLRAQKALAERADDVEAANHAKDRFLAMLSHELRTPLTPVLAAAGALENDPRLPDEAREDLHMICRNIGIQSRLIDDLLDLTRISRGKIQVESQVLGLSILLRDSARIVAVDLDARNQTLKLPDGYPREAAVLGDGPRLQQVLWNLLKNAIKFSPPGAEITLSARVSEAEKRIHIEVTDQGAGIAPKDLERIFLPFEQAFDGRRHGNDQGLGLGLAIAKAIVEVHSGTLDVTSEGLGRGATFHVTLPLAEQSAPQGQADSAVNHAIQEEAPVISRVLLVEDHLDTGLILTRLLKRAGFEVHHAGTASEGFRAFQEQHFDVVVSDLGLPDESGLDLMRRIGQLRPGVPAICLSGFGMEEDTRACKEAGFTEHLTKPVEMPVLQAALSRILRKQD